MAVLIDKDGNKIEINYYDIGNYFDEVINNLPSKDDYYKFRESYNNFSPNFDYAMLELGYSIDEPFGPDTKIVVEDNKIYYYHPSSHNENIIRDRVYQLSRVEVNPASYDGTSLTSGILDSNNNYYTIPGISAVHTTLPFMLLNNIMLRNKNVYNNYLNFEVNFTKEMCFLEDYLGCVRISTSINSNAIYTTYSGSMLSNKQKNYLSYLRGMGFFKNGMEVDTDKSVSYQRKVHSDK